MSRGYTVTTPTDEVRTASLLDVERPGQPQSRVSWPSPLYDPDDALWRCNWNDLVPRSAARVALGMAEAYQYLMCSGAPVEDLVGVMRAVRRWVEQAVRDAAPDESDGEAW